MKNLSQKFATFSQDFRNVHQEAKKQGFVNIMKLLWKDLFVGRTAFQWIYLLLLSSVPFFLEWTNRTGQHDWLGLFASWTQALSASSWLQKGVLVTTFLEQ